MLSCLCLHGIILQVGSILEIADMLDVRLLGDRNASISSVRFALDLVRHGVWSMFFLVDPGVCGTLLGPPTPSLPIYVVCV